MARGRSGTSLTGDKELDRKFKRLADKAAKKVAAQGIRAGLRIIAKGIKAEIPGHMKEARKAIGTRFKRKKTGEVKAIVGGGVGKKKKLSQGRDRPGVGIGQPNIHWLLLGTNNRFQKSGASTGSTLPIPAVRLGFNKSEAAALQKIKDAIKKGIAREAKKK